MYVTKRVILHKNSFVDVLKCISWNAQLVTIMTAIIFVFVFFDPLLSRTLIWLAFSYR